jgi:hypothetical protein
VFTSSVVGMLARQTTLTAVLAHRRYFFLTE